MVAAAKQLGFALSARALLLLSLVGAFVLAVMAMNYQTQPALAVLVFYAAFTVIPITVLEWRKRS